VYFNFFKNVTKQKRYYDCGPNDGKMGKQTAIACQEWIKDQGEDPKPDLPGVFGVKTAKAF
tara:strand:- start:374 stop:556 length:183 start_codon:yes stop_codon:yes gene_type:complete